MFASQRATYVLIPQRNIDVLMSWRTLYVLTSWSTTCMLQFMPSRKPFSVFVLPSAEKSVKSECCFLAGKAETVLALSPE